MIDGLILAGGNDIDPSAYGAEPHPETKHTVPERDRAELALARRAIERDMPVLGICRGMQLINVAFGGTLTQHLPDEVGHERHRPHPGSFDDSDHEVRLTEGSLAALAAGETVHNTKSHHHQGVEASPSRSRSRATRCSTTCPRRSRPLTAGSCSASSGTPRPTSAAA